VTGDGPPKVVGGLPCVELQSPDGARAVISRLGAQVLSWRPAGGAERLYLSERAVLDGSGPIRGGVPLVFPQFANGGPLPAHGFARNRVWAVQAPAGAMPASTARFTLQGDVDEPAAWPHAFGCVFTVQLAGPVLVMRLEVSNRGAAPFSFQAALHTYLRVDDLPLLRVQGLADAAYRDRSAGDRPGRQAEAELALQGDVDRIYSPAPRQVAVCEPGRVIRIGLNGGFGDLVVWNPGAERCARVPDLPPDGYRHFVCVEAARIVLPVELQPGHSWWGEQQLAVADPGG
jgi:glucose-6-phosphate 1-epimerase